MFLSDERFVLKDYNVIFDTEEELWYEAFDKKSAMKLLKVLNRLNREKEEYKRFV